MLLEAVETLFEWENCEKSFKNPQGHPFHAKVRQGIIPKEYCTSEPPVMQSAEELISLLVKDVVENLVNKVVSTRAKSEGASKVAVKKCHQYSAALKGKTINAYDNRNRLVRLKANFQMAQKAENHPPGCCIFSPKVVSQRKAFNKMSWTVQSALQEFFSCKIKGHRVQPESSNWTLIWKLKLNIMIMWAFCSKKSWQWDQNKEAQERNGKITEGMACNVQRKVHSDRIGRL